MKTMKKTRGQKVAAIRAILEKTPGRAPALVVEDMKKQGFPNTKPQDVYNARNVLRKKVTAKAEAAPKSEPKVAESSEPILCQFRIPQAGAMIKVTNKHGMVGTITVTEKGVVFAKAKSKSPTPRMSWDLLEQLGQSGLIPRS